MKNHDVRAAAKDAGIKLWQIADALGIADTTFCKRLRYELAPEQKAQVFEAIRSLAGEVDGND